MENLKIFKYISNDYECTLQENTKGFWERVHDGDNWFGILEIKYKNESIYKELTNIKFTEQYLGYFIWLCDELIKSYEKKLDFNVCCRCDHITETNKVACWYSGHIEVLNVCQECIDDYYDTKKNIEKCNNCGCPVELDRYYFYFKEENRWYCYNCDEIYYDEDIYVEEDDD